MRPITNSFSIPNHVVQGLITNITNQTYGKVKEDDAINIEKKVQLQHRLHEVSGFINESIHCDMALNIYNDGKNDNEKFYIFDLAHFVLNQHGTNYDEDKMKKTCKDGGGGPFMRAFCEIVGQDIGNNDFEASHVQTLLNSMLEYVLHHCDVEPLNYCSLLSQESGSFKQGSVSYNSEVLENSLVSELTHKKIRDLQESEKKIVGASPSAPRNSGTINNYTGR